MLPRPRAAFAALVAVIVAAAAAPAADAATSDRLLTVRSVAVGTSAAPVRVTVRTPSTATVRLWVNGRAVPDAFPASPTTTRTADLSSRDGLRPGRNRLRVRSVGADLRSATTVRTVTLRRTQLLADAGADAHVGVGAPMGLGGVGLAGARSGATHRWRILRAPRGSRAVLRNAGGERPVLTPDRRGLYRLRLTTRTRSGRLAHDTRQLFARSDDAPVGVRIETLSTKPGGAVRIDGTPVAATDKPDNINMVIVDRRTREVKQAESWSMTRDGGAGIAYVADQFKDTTNFIFIISSLHGATNGALEGIAKANGLVGGLVNGLTEQQRVRIADGGAFSIVGVTGSAPGSNWVDIPFPRTQYRDAAATTAAAANLSGWLRLTPATDRYDYVEDTAPSFDTSAGGVGPRQNRTVVAGETRTVTLPDNHREGFHLLVLDASTLTPIKEDVIGTDTADGADPSPGNLAARRAEHEKLATAIAQARALPGRPIVILQSIGAVHGGTWFWSKAADDLEHLGANPKVFLALNGDTFSFVGREGDLDGAQEASSRTQDGGRLAGLLGRERQDGYGPLLADPYGVTNTDFVGLVNQAPVGFPQFTSPGERAAYDSIGVEAGVCAKAPCDIRAAYWKDYRGDWATRYDDIVDASRPKDATAEEFARVKTQIRTEVRALLAAKNYFKILAQPFGAANVQALIDVDALATQLYQAIQPAPAGHTTSYYLGLSSQIVGVLAAFGTLGPPASTFFGVVSASLGVASTLTDEQGQPVGGDLQATAAAFKQTVLTRLQDAQNQIQSMAVLVASDWGRLQVVKQHIDDHSWQSTTVDGATLNTLRLALKRWMAQALVPAAYPLLLRGNGNPASISCGSAGLRWNGYPPSMVGDFPLYYDFGDVLHGQSFWLWRSGSPNPPAALGALLFNAPDASPAGLGLKPVQLYTRQFWPYLRYVDAARGTDCIFEEPTYDGWPRPQ
jgi:hypothetical protein